MFASRVQGPIKLEYKNDAAQRGLSTWTRPTAIQSLSWTRESNIKHPSPKRHRSPRIPDLNPDFPTSSRKPKVHNLNTAAPFRTRWQPRPRTLYSQAGHVGGQWAPQCPPAGRGQLPATAVQHRKAAGAGRWAQAGPGSGQQRLRKDEQPCEGSQSIAQAPLLPDAAGRGRHLPPAGTRSRTAASSEPAERCPEAEPLPGAPAVTCPLSEQARGGNDATAGEGAVVGGVELKP